MTGATEEAKQLRTIWMEEVEQRLQQGQNLHRDVDARWERICQICRDVAVQVCGILDKAPGAPWLKDKQEDIRRLDQEIARVRDQDREARHSPVGRTAAEQQQYKRRARRQLQEARKLKMVVFNQWEEDWMTAKAKAADRAADFGHSGTLFAIIKELTQVKEHRRSFGFRRDEDPAGEAEAWKQHFEHIQSGVGQIPDEVWRDITPLPVTADWLSSPPTPEEIQKSINDMSTGKAPGSDLLMAEFLKYGGPALRAELAIVISQVWQTAQDADEGQEAAEWPKRWREGIIFPLWKRKGSRHDRNTWRGITLLSVGSKVVARIVAGRLQVWSSTWSNPLQFGFTKGSGVDDVQQLTRAFLEDAAGSAHDRIFVFRFFDLEKAYPRVARHGLWTLLTKKGCPAGFLKVLKALHNHTASAVRFQGHLSSSFVPDRGLREGCPSSPILFNLYHAGILEVFRARRARAATAAALTPGITWAYKIDGRVGKRATDRFDAGRHVRRRVFGDFAYADDTGIVGEGQEIHQAENLFNQTIRDFAGKVNVDKTEGLRVTQDPPPAYDVPWLGEAPTVKHVGALLSHRASHAAETSARLLKSQQKLGWVASAWTQGRGAHRNKSRIKFSVRIQVMKAVVKGVLFSFSKTRAWQQNHLQRAQKVINMAIRRCLGLRLGILRSAGLNNANLRRLVQWEEFESAVRRSTLMWVGHVARMAVEKPQKVAMFGWIDGNKARPRAPPRQAQWINSCLRAAQIADADWFRLAQNKNEWKRRVQEAFPPEKVHPDREQALNAWRPGRPLPAFANTAPNEAEAEDMAAGSEEDIGEVRRGRARQRVRRMYARGGGAEASRHERAQRNAAGQWECPVCQETFLKANQFAFHYEEHHAICDPNLVTVQSFTCEACGNTFRRAKQLQNHTCPANTILPRLNSIDPIAQVSGPPLWDIINNASYLVLFTDGSGGIGQGAGWGVGIFTTADPDPQTPWVSALYGPVITLRCDPETLGAQEHTNNTAELSAIGEACKWLLSLPPLPQGHRSALLCYDSAYAYGIATRLTTPQTNFALAESGATLVATTRSKLSLTFKHVRGHTGIHGNEVADRLAARGANGRVSPHCAHLVRRPPGPMGGNPAVKAKARPKPAAKRALQRRMADEDAEQAEEVEGRPGYFLCSKCHAEFRKRDLQQHFPICRGPGNANLTCMFCRKVLGSLLARKNHERYTHPHEALAAGLIGSLPKKCTR
jgi:ribonuclease HI